MASTATLNVQVLMDATNAANGLNQTAQKFEGAFKKMAAAAAGAFAVDKVKDFVSGAINAASDLNETVSKSATIFGDQGAEIQKWAEGAAESMGLSTQAALSAAAGFGNFFKQVGVAAPQAAQMSEGLVKLAADFASFNNIDSSDALDALQAGLVGEYDAMQKLVPTINAAAVEQRALADTHKSTAAQLTAAEKATAFYALTVEGAGDATDDFSRTADGLANSQRIANAEWENAQAKIGQAFLPAMTSVVNVIKDAIPLVSEIAQALLGFGTQILNLPQPVFLAAGAIGGLLLLGPRLGGFVTSIGTAITGLITKMEAMRIASLTTATSLNTFGLAAANVGRGLLAAFGGIPGIIATAVTALAGFALFKWAQGAADATAEAERFTAQVEALQGVLKSGGDLRQNAYDRLSENWKGLVKTGETLGQTADRLGLNLDVLLDGLITDGPGGTQVVDQIDRKIADLKKQQFGSGDTMWDWLTPGVEQNQAITDQIADLEAAKGAYQTLVPQLGAAKAAEEERTRAALNGADATKAGGTAAETAAEQAARLAQEEKDLADWTKKTTQAFEDMKGPVDEAFRLGTGNQLVLELERAEDSADRAGKVIHAALEKAFPERNDLRRNGISELVGDVREAGKAIKDEDIGGQVRDIFKDIQNQDPIKLQILGEPGQVVQDWTDDFRDDWDSSLVEIFNQSGGNVDETVKVMLGHTKNITQGVADSLGITFEQAEAIVKKTVGNIDETSLKDKVLTFTAEDRKLRETTLIWDSLVLDPVTKTFKTDIQTPEAQEIADQVNHDLGLVDHSLDKLNIPTGTTPPTPEDIAATTANAQAAAALHLINIPSQVGAPKPPGGAFGRYMVGGDLAGTPTPPITVPSLVTPPPKLPGPAGGAATGAGAQTAPIVTVPVITNLTQAQAQINAFTSASRKVAPLLVSADMNQAQSQVTSFMSVHREVFIDVRGNINPWQATITGVMSQQRDVSVSILGNSASFQRTMSSVENGDYVATVRIVADTSSFNATFNSLPTTRAITNAPRVSTTAGVAPTLFGATARSSVPVATQTINIKVNAGINSPDSVARAIKRVVLARDRRATTVYAG